jgi:hypothetical protein
VEEAERSAPDGTSRVLVIVPDRERAIAKIGQEDSGWRLLTWARIAAWTARLAHERAGEQPPADDDFRDIENALDNFDAIHSTLQLDFEAGGKTAYFVVNGVERVAEEIRDALGIG